MGLADAHYTSYAPGSSNSYAVVGPPRPHSVESFTPSLDMDDNEVPVKYRDKQLPYI